MNAHNTFDDPDVVRTSPFHGARVQGDTLTVELPAKSVVVLEMQ
jgi:alpha-N-arabinofuranosidase